MRRQPKDHKDVRRKPNLFLDFFESFLNYQINKPLFVYLCQPLLGAHLFSTNSLGYVVASNLVDAVNFQTEGIRDVRVLLAWLVGMTVVVVIGVVWPTRT